MFFKGYTKACIHLQKITLQEKTKTVEMFDLRDRPIHLPMVAYVNTMLFCSNLAYKSTFVCVGVSYNNRNQSDQRYEYHRPNNEQREWSCSTSFLETNISIRGKWFEMDFDHGKNGHADETSAALPNEKAEVWFLVLLIKQDYHVIITICPHR